MDQWLVRTAENVIAGPYTRDQIKQLIREARLRSQDEVCQANDFWMELGEHERVSKVFGTEVLRWMAEADEEDTQTETETATQKLKEKTKSELLKRATAQEPTGVFTTEPFDRLPPRKKETRSTSTFPPSHALAALPENEKEQQVQSMLRIAILVGVMLLVIFVGMNWLGKV